MSKYVKDLIIGDVKWCFEGVDDCVLVNVIGFDVNMMVVL